MKYIVFFLLLTLSSSASSQISRVDSVVNAYERKYRDVINDSDQILIENQVIQIESDAALFDTILNSNFYSNEYIKKLTSKLVESSVCLDGILNNISYSSYNNLAQEKKYSVFDGVVENKEYSRILFSYLQKSDYLEDCSFLIQKDKHWVELLSYFTQKENLLSKIKFSKGTCKEANLIILKGFYNER